MKTLPTKILSFGFNTSIGSPTALPLFFFLMIYLVFIPALYATHNRAGEITYEQISELKFRVTIITYTNSRPGAADRPELEIRWGDNTLSILNRIEEIYLPDYYKRNKYVGIHEYPGPGDYTIVVEDPNRNEGVLNIPNSVTVVFSIRTTMRISPDLGVNNTPILLNPPVDKAALNQVFIHNPAAFDVDGDSISYKLTKCTGQDGEFIPGYTFPPASHSFYINEETGDLVWDSPNRTGIYNVAILIEEWRNGVRIGKITRDMQIEVYDSENTAPRIDSLPDQCIEANQYLEFDVRAADAEGDAITLSAASGAFEIEQPAEFTAQKLQSESREIIVPFIPDVEFKNIVFTVPQRGDRKKLLELSERNLKYYLSLIHI